MNKLKFSHIIFILLLLPVLGFLGVKIYVNVPQFSGSVLGANTQLVNANVDFTNKIFDSSPLLFGGVHAPDPADTTVWNTLQNVGVTLLRSDFFIEYCAPKNITLADYKNNVNNVQDTRNWTKACLSSVSQIYSLAKKRNMKVVAVVAYTPPWLTQSKTPKDLPVDWEVYDDLVTKMYKLNREYIDYVEVWNEPDNSKFLKTAGKSKEDDYVLLYQHVSQAIRKVDDQMNDGKRVLIGGPAISCPCQMGYVQKILENPETKKNLDFISIHSYMDGDQYIPKIKEMMKRNGAENMPLFISEWNKSSIANNDRQYNQTYQAVTYTAGRLIDFMNQGIDMAAYFSLRPNDPTNTQPERQAYGFYRVENGKYKIFPQQWVWQLLSKNLELGQGPGQIVSSSTDNQESSSVLGFKNLSNVQGFVVSNPATSSSVNFTAKGVGDGDKSVIVELSKITEKGLQQGYCVERYTPKSGNVAFKFDVPSNSVVAVTFTKSDHSLKELSKILSPTTQNNCLIFEN